MGLIMKITSRRNPLPPKTENGEYMTYDQYA